jgi:hypothetical protein
MGLTRLSDWFSKNSAALQGVAALTLILAASIPVLRWIVRSYRADVTVQLDWSGSAIPPDLSEWTREIGTPLQEVADSESKSGAQPPIWAMTRLIELAKSRTGELLSKQKLSDRSGCLNIVIQNNSDEVVSNLRVRVSRFHSFWRAFIAGQFLTKKETDDFNSKGGEENNYSDVVLPELPPLPANGVVTVSVYGDGEFSDVDVSASGHSTRVSKTVRIQDSWFTSVLRNPVPYGLILFWLVVTLAPFYWAKLKRKAAISALPDMLYNLACDEAKAGRPTLAMNFLRKAFQIGYSNKAWARNDDDLTSLRDLEEFKELTRSE